MKRRRVKITGIGPVTPAGIGRDEFWKGILEPVSRVRPFGKLDEGLGPFVAAFIDDEKLEKYRTEEWPRRAARHTLFALAGAALALKDAGISAAEFDASNCVVITGSAIMDFGGIVDGVDSVAQRGARGAKPWLIQNVAHGSVANTIIDALGVVTARTMAVSNQCCSGMDAVAHAASLIASGAADIAICGGTEAPLHRSPLVEFRAAGLTPFSTDMAERIARPFDLWRTTGVVGEGACMLILEAEESKRKGYSYVSGYGSAHDDDDDLCSGLATVAKLATADAGIRLSDLEVISAWGPGHKQIDRGEVRAMQSLFGPALAEMPAFSIKASIGTPLGAAPAIQLAASALAQFYGTIPPTAGWSYSDPDCPLRLSSKALEFKHSVTLVNSHGMGAVNGGMILQRC